MPKVTIVVNALLIAVPALVISTTLAVLAFRNLNLRTEDLIGGMREDAELDPADKRALRALAFARFWIVLVELANIVAWVGAAWWFSPHKREIYHLVAKYLGK